MATNPPKTTKRTKHQTTYDYQQAFQTLGYSFAYNEMTGMDMIIDGKSEIELTDHKESEVMCKMHDLGFFQENRIRHQIKNLAYQNSYHPIKRYLESLPPYDGRNNVQELSEYVTADVFFTIFLWRWALGAVSKIYKQTQNPMLVLSGDQGIGKSYLAKALNPFELQNYFTEGPLAPDQKDTGFRASQIWIWEVSELGSTTRRADIESLKGFLSQGYITARRPYGRQDERRPITANYIGTINNGEAGFLNDPSGSRRFMVTKIEKIDWEGYMSNWSVDGFWSQAFHAFKMNEKPELTPEELKLSIANNENYKAPDPIEIAFDQFFEVDYTNNFMSTNEILNQIRGSSFIKTMGDEAIQRRLSEYLVSKGAVKAKRNDITGKKVWGYANVTRI